MRIVAILVAGWRQRTGSLMRDHEFSCLQSIAAAQGCAGQPGATFVALADTLQQLVGHKVMTVLRLDATALRSVRMFSTEPSYPPGGIKQHQPGRWSEAIVDRGSHFLAATREDVREAFF